MSHRWYALTAIGAVSLTLLAAAACSASNETTSSGDATNQGGSTGQSTGGSTGDGGDNVGGMFNPNVGGNGAGGEEVCEAQAAEAEQKILDMIVVLDRSGSMQGTKWNGSVAALTSFFNDPTSQGVFAGINFFPPNSAADECAATTYNPPQVPLGELSAYAPTLVDALDTTLPGGLTPTYGAMLGSLQFATAYQDSNPEHVVVVVLASDGAPVSCNTSIPAIAGLSQSAYNYNGVRTYAIAIQGSSVANLNTIAAAGGTGQAFDVTSDISLFKQKMEEIRAEALGCEYLIPIPMGMEFDPVKLNVEYTPGGSMTPQELPQADNEADCGAGPGWYYDNPANPTKVILCPGTCAQVETDVGAKVELLFGCPTKFN